MAFPFIFESNFETGSNADWDSETDTVAQLDFPHFSELARMPGGTECPLAGAYCMRASLVGGTADAFVTEGDINITLAAQNFFAFDVFFDKSFTGTANDTFNLFEAQSTSNVAEITVSGRIVAATDVINLGIGKVAATSWSGIEIQRGVWYTVEIDTTPATGGAGTIDVFITKEGDSAPTVVSAAQVGSLTNLAITHGVLGIQDHLATTTGTILFDRFIQDDARIYPLRDRFTESVLLTKSAHAFIGPGEIRSVELLSGGGTDNVATIYDTNKAESTIASNIVAEIKNLTANEMVPLITSRTIKRGAYVVLSGTNPRALVNLNSNAVGRTIANVRYFGRA